MYGWSTEYILGRTEREIAWRLEQIGLDYDNNLMINAKLHGVEYKPKNKKQDTKLTLKPETEDKIQKAILEAQERKRLEYGNRS